MKDYQLRIETTPLIVYVFVVDVETGEDVARIKFTSELWDRMWGEA